MLKDEQKAEIDALSFEELSDELLKQSSARFHGEARDYLLARYGRLENEKDSKKHQELMELQKKRIHIAEDANKLSKIAIWVSVLAFIIALWSLMHDFRVDNKDSNEYFNNDAAKNAAPVK